MILLDSAVAPTPAQLAQAHPAGVRWAGYLHSPTTYHGGWAPSALWAAAHVLGGVLPVWVAPLGATTAKQGAADARTALAQLAAAHLTAVVALDTEASAASKPGALDYAHAFHAAVHAARGHTVQYGPLSFLAAQAKLAGTDTRKPDAPWLARWVTKMPTVGSESWPTVLASWPEIVRGWQWTHDRPSYGLTVDLSVCAASFPLAQALSAPTPPPPPPKPVTHTVTVSIDGRQILSGPVTL